MRPIPTIPAAALNPACKTVSVAEFAAVLGVTPGTLLRWLGEGRLPRPVLRTPRRTLWRRQDVEALFADHPQPEDASHAS
jgi:excisionase family DNA binding protein